MTAVGFTWFFRALAFSNVRSCSRSAARRRNPSTRSWSTCCSVPVGPARDAPASKCLVGARLLRHRRPADPGSCSSPTRRTSRLRGCPENPLMSRTSLTTRRSGLVEIASAIGVVALIATLWLSSTALAPRRPRERRALASDARAGLAMLFAFVHARGAGPDRPGSARTSSLRRAVPLRRCRSPSFSASCARALRDRRPHGARAENVRLDAELAPASTSCAPRAPASSGRATTSGAGSSATSTTAPSSASSRSRSTCGSPAARSTPTRSRRASSSTRHRGARRGHRRAARARARHPPGGPHRPRARGGPRAPSPPRAGPVEIQSRTRPRRAPSAGRVGGLLRGRRGAHERRPYADATRPR